MISELPKPQIEEAQLPLVPLEPLRSLTVAVELIPMRSKQALYMFLHYHQEEFPARYMNTFFGKQTRMLYDREIRQIREMLLIEDGSDAYHTPAMLAREPRRPRPRSPIDEIMRRAMVQARA